MNPWSRSQPSMSSFFRLYTLDDLPRFRDRREYHVFKQLLQMVPGLEQRIINGSEADLSHVADLVRNLIILSRSY